MIRGRPWERMEATCPDEALAAWLGGSSCHQKRGCGIKIVLIPSVASVAEREVALCGLCFYVMSGAYENEHLRRWF